MAKAMPMWHSAVSTGSVAGKRKSISEPSLAQVIIWCSLLAVVPNAWLRSISLTAASMPIFFQCWVIISPTCV